MTEIKEPTEAQLLDEINNLKQGLRGLLNRAATIEVVEMGHPNEGFFNRHVITLSGHEYGELVLLAGIEE